MLLLLVVSVLICVLAVASLALHDHIAQVRHERELDERIATRMRHPSRGQWRHWN
jgi:hypothetical protein